MHLPLLLHAWVQPPMTNVVLGPHSTASRFKVIAAAVITYRPPCLICAG